MKRLIGGLVMIGWAIAAPLYAAVPSTMSYQGVLTDNLGNLVANGNYNFVFKVYTVPAAGAPIWTEAQNAVPLTKGGFNVMLGTVTPLNLAFDVPYYLGIAVNGGAELAPRVSLTSSPYGLSLRLPFSGSASSSAPVLSVANGGAGADIALDHLLTIGSPTASGELRMGQNGAPSITAQLYDYSAAGAALDFYDESGGFTLAIEPDGNGTGGYFYVGGGTGGGSVVVDGMSSGDSPEFRIEGPGSSTDFVTTNSGDAAVTLPASSVSAAELLDETGIAQEHGSSVDLNATMTDIVSVTITTPAPGYVVVKADGQHNTVGNGTNSNYAALQITESSVGAIDGAHYFYSGYSGVAPNGNNWSPASIHRTYFKAAGTYTFYFQGYKLQSALLSNYVYNPTITALYYPTSYGAVTEIANASESAQYSHVTRVSVVSSPGNPTAGAASLIQVDLRELELKAAKAKADAELAQRRLIEAEWAQQTQQAAAIRATLKKQ